MYVALTLFKCIILRMVWYGMHMYLIIAALRLAQRKRGRAIGCDIVVSWWRSQGGFCGFVFLFGWAGKGPPENLANQFVRVS